MNNQKQGFGGKIGSVTAKPKNTWQTTKRLMRYMKKSIPAIVLTVIVAIAGTIMQVLNPKILGSATTLIFNGAKGRGIDFTNLFYILTTVALLYIGVFVTSFLQQRSLKEIS